jgi:superfamily II DNA or RNA helicase
VTKADQAARALVALLPFWGRAFQLVSAHSTDSLDFNLQAPGPSERPLNVIRRDRLTRIVDGLSTESRKIAARTMPSNHANAGLLIRRGLYDNLHSFAELEQRISTLGDENSKAVGDAFEVFVEGYLATHQKLQAETVWLVGQVPQGIRQQMNLPNDAKGIDGIFRTRTGVLVPYQVKFRSQRAYLTYTQIAPFLGLTERATDRIVFTNSNELAEDVTNRDAMRTVRGIDFDDLTEDDLRAISAWLRRQPVAITKPKRRESQIEALAKITDTLAKSDRAHVVMASGTGKTLVALWAAEALQPKTVLVLLPSLTLLQQTLDEWSRHNNWGKDFTYLCVCSDPTVAARDANDPVRLDATDLEFRVDTSPDEVRRFIERDAPGVKVVFSTYQSSPVVAQGVQGLAPFDVAIFDEAHKTTGPQGGLFAHSLKDENISIRKRLFFTATPRHYDIRHRDKEGDFRIISMDDEATYGPRAYTLTFGSAARQGIICSYKVVISVVDGQEINAFALKHGITLVEGDLIAARWVGNQIAVERAVEETGAKRAITFHSRVSSAMEFSSDSTHGIRQYLPAFSVFHVNGDQKSSERKQLIRSFRDAEKALVTNARCLTEGIDVPAVDMVAFIDPRHSKIDIAQATGRAMRKPPGSNKKVGYVVIPLFRDRRSGETLEEALERSEFDDVADVLNAMREQDEDLAQIIRELQEAKGRGEIFDPRRLSEKIEVLGPPIELSALRANICAEIVDAIGVSWDEMFGRLQLFRDMHEHCRVPATFNDKKLAKWVLHQRNFANKGTLSEFRRRRLEDIGFEWDPLETDWADGLRYLTIYKKREGHCRVLATHKENGFPLGQWVRTQRGNAETLSAPRRQQLDELGFVWDPLETDWAEGFRYLTIYKEREGHCRVPRAHKENGFSLGSWVVKQRHGKNQETLPEARQQQLDELGFIWDPRETDWAEGFRYLTIYKEREGHCRVPQKHMENGFRLGQWVGVQRGNAETLSAPRRQQLDELGFVWDPVERDWAEGFRYLTIYKEREGHCRVPATHKENGFRLGQWVVTQRHSQTLSEARRQQLDELGFVWDPFETDWAEGFRYLTIYKEREGHCRVPATHKENGFGLGSWVDRQRQSKDQETLPEARRQQLDELGFVWDPFETDWAEGFRYLTIYREREGHCRVLATHKENGFPLGQWVRTQRGNADTLSALRRQQLDELGFVWDPFETDWAEGFRYLTIYREREGHCRVPATHKENGFRLGQWVGAQRGNADTLSAPRRQQLDELGFIWDPFETDWAEGFRYLTIYREREGHCRVPRAHKENGFSLGQWVSRQRHRTVSEARRQRLDKLGFVWDPFEAD